MPYRGTTQYLAERGELPSKLSKYSVVQPVPVSVPTANIETKDSGKAAISTSSWNEMMLHLQLFLLLGCIQFNTHNNKSI